MEGEVGEIDKALVIYIRKDIGGCYRVTVHGNRVN